MGDETRGLLQEAHSIRRQAERLSDLDGAAVPGSVTSEMAGFTNIPDGADQCGRGLRPRANSAGSVSRRTSPATPISIRISNALIYCFSKGGR